MKIRKGKSSGVPRRGEKPRRQPGDTAQPLSPGDEKILDRIWQQADKPFAPLREQARAARAKRGRR